MVKSRELSKVDEQYLLSHRDDDVKQLSKDINVILPVVREHMENMPERQKEDAVEPKRQDPTEQDKDIPKVEENNPQTDIGDLYARNERYGAVVSTPAASQVSDATRHHRVGKADKLESMIHRCKPKKNK